MSHPNKENKNGDFPTKVTALASCLQRHEFCRVVKAVLPITLSAQRIYKPSEVGLVKPEAFTSQKHWSPLNPLIFPGPNKGGLLYINMF